jgi:hypothetical protein
MVLALVVSLFTAACATDSTEPKAFTTSLVLLSATDFILSGGAQVLANPVISLRSGNPGQRSVAAISIPLSSGTTLKHVSFEYSYTVGFGAAGTGNGSNFTVRAAGTEVYASPHCTDYPYSKAHPNYSHPVAVNVPVSIQIPAGKSHLEFDFDNNDRNLQLKLPLRVNISCIGGPCASYPLLPAFIDSNMVLQRAPHKANIWGENAVAGESITATMVADSNLDGETPAMNVANAATRTQGMQQWNTTADAAGGWLITMAPQEASTDRTISIQFGASDSGRTVVLENIAFGDVYFCSGQSNMEFSLNHAFNATAEIADSVHYPNLRMFTAAHAVADLPMPNVADKTGGAGAYANSSWAVSAPGAFCYDASCPVGSAAFSW